MQRALLLLLLVGLYFSFVGKVLGVFIADIYHVQSSTQLEAGNIEGALVSAKRSIEINTLEPAYLRHRAKVYLAKKVLAIEQDRTEIERAVMQDLLDAQKLNPRNLATLRNSVPLYYFWANSPEETAHFGEFDEYIESKKTPARAYFTNLKTTYNNDLGLLADIAKNEKKLGFIEDFEQTRALAEELRPDVVAWHPAFR